MLALMGNAIGVLITSLLYEFGSQHVLTKILSAKGYLLTLIGSTKTVLVQLPESL